MAVSAKPDTAVPPQAPSAAKGAFMRRIFPFLLATNVFIGVYVFAKTYKRDQEKKYAQATAAAAAAAALSSPASTTAKALDPTPAPVPKRVLPPLSEDEQRHLYRWMLEEKRKIKPRNAAEKNKINEEKALLKEFIRAVSPSFVMVTLAVLLILIFFFESILIFFSPPSLSSEDIV